MHLLVTGGAGFIGSQYVRSLLSTDRGSGISRILVLDALTYAGNLENLVEISTDPRYTFVHGDITDSSLVHDLMSDCDAVVHFAAESHVDRSISGSSEFIRTNVLGTHTLLEAAKQSNIDRFVHVSTDEVYGSIDIGSWPETDPLKPNSPYAASKASSDLLVRSYFKTHGLNTVTTRCSNNYGPYQHPEKLIPLFTTNLIKQNKVPLYGNGLNVRDWLHVDDHCNGIHLALTKGDAGEIYNIGGGTELSNVEITKLILASFNKSWDESVVQVEDRKGHDLRYSVNWAKANEQLGYEPRVHFLSGIEETINWYRNNEDWWNPLAVKSKS
jgi:dTDP-glucose 4,6-dehydratase